MSMGIRKQRERQRERQEPLWYRAELAEGPGQSLLSAAEPGAGSGRVRPVCEQQCREFYHEELGRPSLAPGTYFRLMLIEFCEGIASERGIAWRVADSLSLRQFLGFGLDEATPDRVTISRTRLLTKRRIGDIRLGATKSHNAF